MATIYKYSLNVTDEQVIEMPAEARVLSAQWQDGGLVAWALVDPRMPTVKRTFRIFGTGNPMAAPWLDFVGTVQEPDRPLVWHVFTDAPPQL